MRLEMFAGLFPGNSVDYLYEDPATEAPISQPDIAIKNYVSSQENFKLINPAATRIFPNYRPNIGTPTVVSNGPLSNHEISKSSYSTSQNSNFGSQPCCSCCDQNSRYFSYQSPQGPYSCSCSNGCNYGRSCACSCLPQLNLNLGCIGGILGGLSCGGNPCGNASPRPPPTRYRCSCSKYSCTCVPIICSPSSNCGCSNGASQQEVRITICCQPGGSNCGPCNRRVYLRKTRRIRRNPSKIEVRDKHAKCNQRCCDYSKCSYSKPSGSFYKPR
uniref:Uncharacterized protein n=1 Tax=Acrobeloides nanus TaxID=290746 RepID=A0A914EQZ7_9BILA